MQPPLPGPSAFQPRQVNEANRKVIISINPLAGRGKADANVSRLRDLLFQAGFDVHVLTDLAEIAELAASFRQAGELRAVVAAGGDGTVAELVNRCEPEVPITTLPQGTENLLAKYLGIASTPDSVARVVCKGAIVHLDAGLARCAATPGAALGTFSRVFLLMASCGLDADVVHRLHQERSGPIRHWSYVKPIWQAVRNYKYPELRISCDGDPRGAARHEDSAPRFHPGDHSARWMFLFNLPCYAWGLNFTPAASGFDGLLDLCSLRQGALLHGMRYLAAVVGKQLDVLSDCVTGQITRLSVDCDVPAPCQFDGDPGGFSPLEIHVLPRRLTLLAPREWASERIPDTVE